MKPSTRKFFQAGRSEPGFSFFDWLHGYIYMRWPYFYIGVATGEYRGSRMVARLWNLLSSIFSPGSAPDSRDKRQAFADSYHGKVLPLSEATSLVTLNHRVDARNLEHIIPYSRAKDIVLHNPDHIVVLDCPCRASRRDPCLPLDVCLIIGEPFADFTLEHHPRRSRRITQKEAVGILREEQRRGHVHHAFFKDAMLGRFYAICNCCACCCGAMQAMRNGTPMLASSGYVSQSNIELCAGCGHCVDKCQFEALLLDNGKIRVEPQRCMGCGVCVAACPNGSLRLVRDPQKGEPLRVEALQ